MAGSPFSDPEINSQIKTDILRLQAAALEWDDDPKGRGFDDHIVWTLVESLDAHAKAYLCKVESQDLVAAYVDYLRNLGAALIRNAEQRSFLSDPYSEDRLRHMAENSFEFAVQKHSLTPAQQEAAIRDGIERLRTANRPDAIEWHQWHSQMCSRIETRFEARYRYWEANAIERAKAGKQGRLAGWFRRLQRELYPDAATDSQEDIPECWRNMLPVSGFAQTGSQNVSPIQEQPATLPLGKANEGLKPQEWEDLEISFLSEERVQIMIGDQTETRNYGELGFMDKRGGKPNQAWGLLRTLAIARGHIPNSARRADPDDILAMGKRFERMRKTLMEHFGISSDPVPLDPAQGYRCRFKIGCGPSFDK
jgi:hypothetical protein